MDLIIGKKSDSLPITQLIADIHKMRAEGTAFIGYPLLPTAEENVAVDALLVSKDFGLVVVDVMETPPREEQDWLDLQQHHDKLFSALQSKLLIHPGLRRRRQLAIDPIILAYFPETAVPPKGVDVLCSSPGHLATTIEENQESISEEYAAHLNAAIESVTTIKPRKKRSNVSRESSRGSIIKKVEKSIANLDRWQKRAALESPEGPQRIRGLAGSGKTVVLALKAAYIHAQEPDWTIAVTYFTRSLRPQLTDFIRRFTFEHIRDEPDWSRVHLVHSWGGWKTAGIYHNIALEYGVEPRDFDYAKTRYGWERGFGGICGELLKVVRQKGPRPLYDMVLVDEAQDLPADFFKLLWHVTREPHHIVWAYDELQNLGSYEMTSPEELFGNNPDTGKPRVSLENRPGMPREDIILPTCYRNTPWALTTAHALGFGTYRETGLVQMFDDPSLWTRIGYEKLEGELEPGRSVALRRSSEATPAFFSNMLTPEDAVSFHIFEDSAAEARWLADSIACNLSNDELEPSDILVIFSRAPKINEDSLALKRELAKLNISCHTAGREFGPDEFFAKSSVAISSIFRAKGNEAPMVYFAGAEHCYAGRPIANRRNILFTAITRSRAWVRVCGSGDDMKRLAHEFSSVVKNSYELRFTIPTAQELSLMRRVNRDRSSAERRQIDEINNTLSNVVKNLENGTIELEDIAPDVKQRLTQIVSQKKAK